MGIGETLAGARRQAGLTVRRVGHRARLKETIIRSIEDDDYAVCGGDSYARANIRAIALAVGLDPRPLVRQYDETRQYPQPANKQQRREKRKYERTHQDDRTRNYNGPNRYDGPNHYNRARQYDWAREYGRARNYQRAYQYQMARQRDTAQERFRQHDGAQPAERRRIRQTAMLAVVILAVLGLASYEIVSTVDHAPHPVRPAVTAPPQR